MEEDGNSLLCNLYEERGPALDWKVHEYENLLRALRVSVVKQAVILVRFRRDR